MTAKAPQTIESTEASAATALALEAVKALAAKSNVIGAFVVVLTREAPNDQFAFAVDIKDVDYDTLAGCAIEGLGAFRQQYK